jgi:hypothetical protein
MCNYYTILKKFFFKRKINFYLTFFETTTKVTMLHCVDKIVADIKVCFKGLRKVPPVLDP